MKSAVFIFVEILASIAVGTRALPEAPATTTALDSPSEGQRIEVRKNRRELTLYESGKPIKTYRIGLGGKPIGPKLKQGDRATPEGDYWICGKNPRSKYYLSLAISYPGPKDAERGLKVGFISRAQHDAILAANKAKRTPPWNTKLGGEIFIHGRGSGSDWTLGCIALNDPDMKELFDRVRVGARVRIEP